MTRCLILSALLWSSTVGTALAQTLEVVPRRLLVDEPAVIRATGLQPNERVALRAELADRDNETWASEAEFMADAQGTVDVSQQAPVKGSYRGISAMGPVWSMRPKAKHVPDYHPPRGLAAQVITFQLVRGGQVAATAQMEQLWVAEGVRRTNLDGELHGIYLTPATSERRPGILVLGGSEGGVPLARAAWLASRGYPALALAYFRYQNLPPMLAGIPLEYFGRALAWMQKQREILPDRIGVMGVSRGGELALQLGSMYPMIKAVVAFVPANVRVAACCGNPPVPYAWTWEGMPLAYTRPRFLLDMGAAMHAAIAVEHMQGPVLLISGEDDGVWPSSKMADAVVSRLKQSHFPQPVVSLKYPYAGHRAGRPEIVPAWHGRVKNPTSGAEQDLGGTPKGDAESSLDAIPKVLDFLRQSLDHATSAQ